MIPLVQQAAMRNRIAAPLRRTTEPLRPRRIPLEFYPTPPEATRALLSVERFDSAIWEPACGDGAIVTELVRAGYTVKASDLGDYGVGETGVDFLKTTRPRAKHIVTNPPHGFGLADRFVSHALALTGQTGGAVAMLLNLQSLVHPRRTPLWRAHPPTAIYAVDDIVCWPTKQYGAPPPHFCKHRYCWAVWRPGRTSPTQFHWLSGADFR